MNQSNESLIPCAPDAAEPLAEVLKRVSDTCDFLDIEVICPNTRGRFGTYPLHVAAVWGDCGAIRALVAAGAHIDQRGEHGFTPLMEAVAQGQADVVKLLVGLGARPLRNDDGQLPSEYAAIGDNDALSAYLAEHGF